MKTSSILLTNLLCFALFSQSDITYKQYSSGFGQTIAPKRIPKDWFRMNHNEIYDWFNRNKFFEIEEPIDDGESFHVGALSTDLENSIIFSDSYTENHNRTELSWFRFYESTCYVKMNDEEKLKLISQRFLEDFEYSIHGRKNDQKKIKFDPDIFQPLLSTYPQPKFIVKTAVSTDTIYLIENQKVKVIYSAFIIYNVQEGKLILGRTDRYLYSAIPSVPNYSNMLSIDPYNLREMINIFILDFERNGIKLTPGNIMINFNLEESDKIAISQGFKKSGVTIRINPKKWMLASTTERWYTLYHELGHDILNLEHGEGGRMMFNYLMHDISWDDFNKDKQTMFEYSIKYKTY